MRCTPRIFNESRVKSKRLHPQNAPAPLSGNQYHKEMIFPCSPSMKIPSETTSLNETIPLKMFDLL